MKRRTLWLGLVAGCTVLAQTGCETLRSGRRDRSVEVPVAVDDAEGESSSAPSGPKGFFSNSRLPGALSSEGADIERSLGVK